VVADLVMAVRRETLDDDDREVRDNRAYYEAVARTASGRVGALLRGEGRLRPLLIRTARRSMARILPRRQADRAPRDTFEKFASASCGSSIKATIFSRSTDLDLAWNLRGPAGYEAEPFYSRACDRAMRLLDERRGNSSAELGWSLQTAPPQSADAVLAGTVSARRPASSSSAQRARTTRATKPADDLSQHAGLASSRR